LRGSGFSGLSLDWGAVDERAAFAALDGALEAAAFTILTIFFQVLGTFSEIFSLAVEQEEGAARGLAEALTFVTIWK